MSEPYQDSAYPDNAYQDQQYYEPEPKKKMSGWLIALIVVLVLIIICCLCACLTTLLAGPSVGNVFSGIVETMEAPMP